MAPENRQLNGNFHRDPATGRFTAGNCANPGGRPTGLASRAREATADGADLVSFHLTVMRDTTERTSDRLTAAAWLADRGWGKATLPIDAEVRGSMALQVSTLRTLMAEEAAADPGLDATESDPGAP